VGAPNSTFKDYKDGAEPEPRAAGPAPWFLLGAGIPLVLLGAMTLLPESSGKVSQPAGQTEPLALAAPHANPLPQADSQSPKASIAPADDPEPEVVLPGTELNLVVRSGDSLDLLFKRNGLDRGDLARIMQLDLAREHLRLIRPGDEIGVRHDEGKLLSLNREVSLTEALSISRGDDGFTAELVEQPIDRQPRLAHGVIQSSLFEAAAPLVQAAENYGKTAASARRRSPSRTACRPQRCCASRRWHSPAASSRGWCSAPS